MPSANTGSLIIKSIKVYKDHVTLSFVHKKEKLKISKEAYLVAYLYEGKTLTKQELNKIKETDSFASVLNYAMSLINKRHYSEKVLKEKLLKKEKNRSLVNLVIRKLIENDLIDDKALMEDLIAWDNERCFGKNKIIKHLKDQGIPESLINKVYFGPSNELKKAKHLIPKLEKKYAKYAYLNKKKHIYQALLAQGFSYEVANEALEGIKEDNPKIENAKLLADYKKIKKRYESKYEGYTLKQKIYAALINKGYKGNQIRKLLEEEL